jgi:cell division protein FtsB
LVTVYNGGISAASNQNLVLSVLDTTGKKSVFNFKRKYQQVDVLQAQIASLIKENEELRA